MTIYGCPECGSRIKNHDCDADLCYKEECVLPLNHRGGHDYGDAFAGTSRQLTS